MSGLEVGHQTSYAKGVRAEEEAAKFLKTQKHTILETRYKTKFGEIDVITQKGNILCFVEVKMRQTLEEALYAITPRNRRRIEQSALFYLSENPECEGLDMRFDVVAISKPFQITHLDNAWEAGS